MTALPGRVTPWAAHEDVPVLASKVIKAGEELSVCYDDAAPFPNSELLTEFGFVPLKAATESVELFASAEAAWGWCAQKLVTSHAEDATVCTWGLLQSCMMYRHVSQ